MTRAWLTIPVVLLISVLMGCPRGARSTPPRTPPTWVLAFAEPDGLKTIQSSNGSTWVRKQRVGFGPFAVGHDGQLTWRVMMGGGSLRFREGVGGVASATEGILWSQSADTALPSISMEGNKLGLAFGNGRWLSAFRGVGRDLRVFVVQQVLPQTAGASPATISPGGTPAETRRSPSLAFGPLNGQGVFTVVYVDLNQQAVAATSTDGVSWSAPAAIAEAWKDPVVRHEGNRVYALLSRPVGNDNRHFLYKSEDGIHWEELGSFAANLPGSILPADHPDRNRQGPSFDIQGCKVLAVESLGSAIQSWEGTLYAPCDDPTTVVFMGPQPVRLLASNQNLSTQGAVDLVYGEGAP